MSDPTINLYVWKCPHCASGWVICPHCKGTEKVVSISRKTTFKIWEDCLNHNERLETERNNQMTEKTLGQIAFEEWHKDSNGKQVMRYNDEWQAAAQAVADHVRKECENERVAFVFEKHELEKQFNKAAQERDRLKEQLSQLAVSPSPKFRPGDEVWVNHRAETIFKSTVLSITISKTVTDYRVVDSADRFAETELMTREQAIEWVMKGGVKP